MFGFFFFFFYSAGLEYNFQRYSSTVIDTLQTRYDYASIMHYPRNAFSSNGRDTIQPRQAGVSIGNRNDFSNIDVFKINTYYECGKLGEVLLMDDTKAYRQSGLDFRPLKGP